MHKKSLVVKVKSQNFIQTIVKLKKKDIEEQKEILSLEKLILKVSQIKESETGLFQRSFTKNKTLGLITEIKFASPTHTNLGKHEDVLKRAKEYEKAGANAISLITEKHYFKGDGRFISQVRENVSIPVLQKDFVIDPYQIYEAKEFGSDALLLIARLIDKDRLKNFVILCFSLGLEPVVEINNDEDLEKALETKTNIIAINARDLETLEVDISKACSIMKKVPKNFIKLSFSGIHSSKEVLSYKKAGAKGILIGTSLMRAENIGEFIQSLGL